MRYLTVVIVLQFIILLAACTKTVRNPVTKDDYTYRDSTTKEVVLHKQDVEAIAEYIQQTDKSTQILYSVAGFVFTLLLGGLIYVLKIFITSNRKLIDATQTLALEMATTKQFNKDRVISCESIHKRVDEAFERTDEMLKEYETRLREVENPKKRTR